MKYMVQWRVHEDKRHEVLKAFASMTEEDDRKQQGTARLIGRWHDVVGFGGVAIVEADDPKALPRWLMHWNAAMDLEVTPVLDDAETRELGREFED